MDERVVEHVVIRVSRATSEDVETAGSKNGLEIFLVCHAAQQIGFVAQARRRRRTADAISIKLPIAPAVGLILRNSHR
jgi:hypothetical protein